MGLTLLKMFLIHCEKFLQPFLFLLALPALSLPSRDTPPLAYPEDTLKAPRCTSKIVVRREKLLCSKKKNEQWYSGEPILPALRARESQIKGGAQHLCNSRPVRKAADEALDQLLNTITSVIRKPLLISWHSLLIASPKYSLAFDSQSSFRPQLRNKDRYKEGDQTGGGGEEYSKWIHSQMSPCLYQRDL
ncbi:conserved hypothetical protein [Ricinus communis]|uniref:Uncharacterized protein n=1 Tax=Ricinus communis TaxID=3988 RepID=B9T0F7_RICCO|nr:conserved hypothetical protein [Ricinus communis]